MLQNFFRQASICDVISSRFRCGVTANIAVFHTAARGSIPRIGDSSFVFYFIILISSLFFIPTVVSSRNFISAAKEGD